MFKRSIQAICFSFLLLALSSCTDQTVRTKQGAAAGSVLGGIAGGIIGHQSGRALEGAAIGAAGGAAVGGVTGSAMDEKEKTVPRY